MPPADLGSLAGLQKQGLLLARQVLFQSLVRRLLLCPVTPSQTRIKSSRPQVHRPSHTLSHTHTLSDTHTHTWVCTPWLWIRRHQCCTADTNLYPTSTPSLHPVGALIQVHASTAQLRDKTTGQDPHLYTQQKTHAGNCCFFFWVVSWVCKHVQE